jgi:GNAT superfamily N-acetyltransferase
MELGAVHFGSRVEFCADADAVEAIDVDSDVISLKKITDEVRELAVTSGKKSRFSKDGRFAVMCRRMYVKWIENCFVAADNGDGEVVGVYDDKGGLSGLMAVTFSGITAKIELISVSSAYRRQGVGKRLVRYAFSFARTRGCSQVVVVTQGENLAGCRLYESCGFKESKRSEIWHLTV